MAVSKLVLGVLRLERIALLVPALTMATAAAVPPNGHTARGVARRPTLRVCADPNNLPFSDRAGRGFENRIAELLGSELGEPVEYTWWAQRRGFVRNTLRARLCDVVIGAPAGDEQLQTTAPYYQSTYVFVTRRRDHLHPRSFDDPLLRTKRVGVHVIGDDYAALPPGVSLARRGIVHNVTGFSIYGDYRTPNPPAALVQAVARDSIDVAIAWGPLAGYYAKQGAVPLDVTPVPDDPLSPAAQFVYPIALGVRKGDDSLHVALERAMTRRRADVQRILRTYGVPVVGDFAAPDTGELAYVTNEGGRMLSVISTATDRVIASIPVGTRPRGVRVSPDGKAVFVALSGSPRCPPTMADSVCARLPVDRSKDGVAEVDPVARRVTRIVPGGVDPEQFDVSPDGRALVAADEDAGVASVVDLATGRVVRQVPVGHEPEGVRTSADGRTAFVTSETDHTVTAFDVATGARRSHAVVDARPRDLALLPGGARYWVSAEDGGTVSLVDVASGRVLTRVALPNGERPMGLALAPSADRLYVSTGRGGTVEVLDARTGARLGVVHVGQRPWGLALTRDGRKLYVANGPSNDVSVVDTRTLRVTATIPVGMLPWGVAIGPAIRAR